MPLVETVGSKWAGALRAGGIAVSRHMSIDVARGPLPLAAQVRCSSRLKQRDIVAVIPDEAFCTINSILDRDECTFMPQPADLLTACCSSPSDGRRGSGVAGELDVWYVAHYLSLTCFLEEHSWFSSVVREVIARAPAAETQEGRDHLADVPTVLEMKRQADFATAPAKVMLAALYYTRRCRVYTAAENTAKGIMAVCPLLDLLRLSSNERSNLTMERLSVTKAALDEISESGLVGWKQRYGARKEDDKASFWCLRAAEDVAAHELLTLVAPPPQ